MGNAFEDPSDTQGLKRRSSVTNANNFDVFNSFQEKPNNTLIKTHTSTYDIGSYSTICWTEIRTVTIYLNESEPTITHEYAISFDTPSDIPDQYAKQNSNSGFYKNTKKSYRVPFRVIKRTNTTKVMQTKNVTCGSGPLFTKDVSIWPTRNRKKFEIKVSPKKRPNEIDCDDSKATTSSSENYSQTDEESDLSTETSPHVTTKDDMKTSINNIKSNKIKSFGTDINKIKTYLTTSSSEEDSEEYVDFIYNWDTRKVKDHIQNLYKEQTTSVSKASLESNSVEYTTSQSAVTGLHKNYLGSQTNSNTAIPEKNDENSNESFESFEYYEDVYTTEPVVASQTKNKLLKKVTPDQNYEENKDIILNPSTKKIIDDFLKEINDVKYGNKDEVTENVTEDESDSDESDEWEVVTEYVYVTDTSEVSDTEDSSDANLRSSGFNKDTNTSKIDKRNNSYENTTLFSDEVLGKEQHPGESTAHDDFNEVSTTDSYEQIKRTNSFKNEDELLSTRMLDEFSSYTVDDNYDFPTERLPVSKFKQN